MISYAVQEAVIMRRTEIPISALPAWTKLNDVTFYDINVHDVEHKGFGIIVNRDLSSENTFDIPMLLRVPKELILSAEAIKEHARVDKHFNDLLTAAGGVSTRGDILLFLLMQITIASLDDPVGVGVSNPWTEYVKMLPSNVPVPTTWTERQQALLVGTSLETPLTAKISSLLREFERLQDRTSEISWCQQVWWEPATLSLSDWILLDSWYRSRCLELPESGESMVPCLDVVNHAREPNAYYEQTSNGDAALLIRPSWKAKLGEEITINYGSSKSAAEMLFSYGFVDEEIESDSLVLDLHPLPDDPLGKAKVAAFSGLPMVRISSTAELIDWFSPFLFFLCLNEEDGLEFKVLQQTDGSQSQLRVFWQDQEVTSSTAQFEQFIGNNPLKDVISLRAVFVLENRIQEQLERLRASENLSAVINSSIFRMEEAVFKAASSLRRREIVLLEKALKATNYQRLSLLESPAVAAYLSSTSGASDNNAGFNEDFS